MTSRFIWSGRCRGLRFICCLVQYFEEDCTEEGEAGTVESIESRALVIVILAPMELFFFILAK